ncbi:MAG: nucleoside phosphorylase [Clostridia bacterium]|nr:nucleoside phosphorylase [Clostridia bacterium]
MSNYPILEYDSSPDAVLEPYHEGLNLELPPCVAFPFVGDCVHEYAQKHGLPVLGEYVIVTKRFPVYRVSDGICLCEAPFGAPAAVSLMDWLIAYGVRRVVSAGSCGALIDLPENTFVVPRRALRDEGTSYHYMPPSRWSYLDSNLQRRIVDVLDAQGFPYVEHDTWTTDAIFRETVDKVRRCRAEGCGVVDMECAALSACAEFRNVEFGQFLYTADSLADADAYDARSWGEASLQPALELCIKVLEAQ